MELHLYFTTDIHGNYFSYDFRFRKEGEGSLERVCGFIEEQRELYGKDSVLLVDGGDIIQGGPEAYYLNHINNKGPHGVGLMTRYVGYDAGVVGNHDIESGRRALKRYMRTCGYPILAANIINSHGQEQFAPYTIVERQGKRVAIVGFTTPATKQWLPQKICQAYRFRNIINSAKEWVERIRAEEQPDFVVALLHSGWEGGLQDRRWEEHAARRLAEEVSGYDLVLYGHDHFSKVKAMKNPDGKKVVCLNAGCYGYEVGEAVIRFRSSGETTVSCRLHDIRRFSNQYSERFKSRFTDLHNKIDAYTNTVIGQLTTPLKIADAFYGPSDYMSLLHSLQLSVTHADISLCSPYFTDSVIQPGPFTIADLYTIYWFEDRLYTIRMKGKEIKNLLERSYWLWTNTRRRNDVPLLKTYLDKKSGKTYFKNLFFNFDSAAGIDYEVDSHKNRGRKINILQMSDGRAFDMEATYLVTTIANRALGGGGMLTLGAGIPKAELSKRIVSYTSHDIRHCLREYIEERGVIDVKNLENWKFLL